MNATSYYLSYADFYTLITYTSYITYSFNYTACIEYFILYWFLQFATVDVFRFYKQLLLYYAIKVIELMMREAVSFEKVFHWKILLSFKS